jgi:hypothetical protein
MFKKILLTLGLIIGATVLFTPASALEVTAEGGISYLSQEGTDPKMGFVVGLTTPVMSDSTKFIQIANETDFLYVKRELKDVSEVTAIRSFMVTTKQLPKNFHIKMGTGGWKVINTAGDDIDYFALRFGAGWISPWGLAVNLELDVVRTGGADMYAPSATITLLGF